MAVLEFEKKSNIFIVTLNNPATGNAINPEALSAHREVLGNWKQFLKILLS